MTRLLSPRSGLSGDARGATVIEFALVAPVLLLTVMGFTDLLYRGYASSILSGAIQKAGRDSTLETGSANLATLDANVIAAVRQIAKNATYTTTRRSYSTFSAVKPEDYTDTNNNGIRDPGECYTDANNNGSWDADGGNNGLGSADDIVVYQVTVTYPRIFPLAKFLGWSTTQQISAKTILRNQPYNEQNIPTPVVRCT